MTPKCNGHTRNEITTSDLTQFLNFDNLKHKAEQYNKIAVFWDLMPCSLGTRAQACSRHLQKETAASSKT
jgi:hypothetical protein